MNPEIAAALKKERVRIARLGGQARAKKLTQKQRSQIALTASKAAAKARIQAAKAKKEK